MTNLFWKLREILPCKWAHHAAIFPQAGGGWQCACGKHGACGPGAFGSRLVRVLDKLGVEHWV